MAQRKIDVVLDSVRRLIRLGATANLVNLLQKQHPADLAQVFSELGEKDRARETLDNALAADPTNDDALMARASLDA